MRLNARSALGLDSQPRSDRQHKSCNALYAIYSLKDAKYFLKKCENAGGVSVQLQGQIAAAAEKGEAVLRCVTCVKECSWFFF